MNTIDIKIGEPPKKTSPTNTNNTEQKHEIEYIYTQLRNLQVITQSELSKINNLLKTIIILMLFYIVPDVLIKLISLLKSITIIEIIRNL